MLGRTQKKRDETGSSGDGTHRDRRWPWSQPCGPARPLRSKPRCRRTSPGSCWKSGRVIDVPKTAALYAPLQQKEPYQGVKVERDVKYGPADRNLLDVFTPETSSSARPVLIFIHGGGFVAGNKRNPGSPFYDNIMLWAVKNGFVGVNATYRLAPQFVWPAGAEDLAAVVQWVSNEDRRARRRSRAHLPDGTIRRRGPCRQLRVASRVSQGEGRRPCRRGDGVGPLRSDGLAGRRCRDRLFRLRPLALRRTVVAAGLLATKIPLMVVAAELDPPRFVEQYELHQAGQLQTRQRMRARVHAAAAQPHLGSLCDQHRGYAPDR